MGAVVPISVVIVRGRTWACVETRAARPKPRRPYKHAWKKSYKPNESFNSCQLQQPQPQQNVQPPNKTHEKDISDHNHNRMYNHPTKLMKKTSLTTRTNQKRGVDMEVVGPTRTSPTHGRVTWECVVC